MGSTSGRAARTLFLDDTPSGNGPVGSSHMLLNEIHTPRRKTERKVMAKTRNNGWKLTEDLAYLERPRTPLIRSGFPRCSLVQQCLNQYHFTAGLHTCLLVLSLSCAKTKDQTSINSKKLIYLWLFIPVFWYLLSYDVLAPLIQRMRAILWINPAERIELSRW